MEKRTIPYLALGGVYGEDDVQAACAVISAASQPGGNFFPLPEEKEFQDAFAAHEGAACTVAVNSAGTALDLCMMALGIGEGDEVITTPLTFICTATCAIARGAKVFLADINPDTLNLDPYAVESRITPRTKAIIPVHFAGLSCVCARFEEISQRYGVAVIYDAAHAVGAKFRRIPVGGMGKASCYSFQSNKNLTTLGEGGAVATNDAEFAEVVRQMKTFGFIYGSPARVVRVGFNYRMTKPQLAVGLNQLKKIDSIIARKRENFLKMNASLANIEEIIPAPGIDDDHGALMHVARLDTGKVSFTRDSLTTHLRSEWGIGTVLHYPPVWSWEVMEKAGYTSAGCPEAEKACSQIFSLPVFATTTEEEIVYIAQALKESIAELNKR
ncbi:MAG: DegT/DnrJ/EryC1/StrS family aminotransferase [Candidatus Latescibacter sp.]|nr:DegT/DnrJ/EryC1/StrS family aminotransferase [Candidatus Latescibacter sp.]